MCDERRESRESEIAIGDSDLINAVSDHINTHIGEVAFVLHPLVSEYAHYLELTMALPPEWPIRDRDLRHHWPFQLLQFIGTLPHEYDSWIWLCHTMTNGPTAAPFSEDTEMCGALLWYPEQAGPDFSSMPHGDHTVFFLGVYPLYQDEMDLKLAHGAEALTDRLEAAEVTELLDPTRPSIA